MNDKKYSLKPNEKWHIYENDYYKNMYITRQLKTYKNTIKIVRY